MREALRSVPVDAFAFVMATGIVSIATLDRGWRAVSLVLAAVAAAAFVALLAALAPRLVRDGSLLTGIDPTFGAFTFVAASAVLASRLGGRARLLVDVLGLTALAVWLLLARLSLARARVHGPAALRSSARGSWLLASVATQSLAILASRLAAGWFARPLVVAACVLWTLGLAVYAAIAALVVARLVSRPARFADATPDSWILMGALAIGALSGARLVGADQASEAYRGIADFVAPGTTAVWVAATAWIPVLVAVEVARAVRHRELARRYDRARWATVFPLGMYSAASHDVAGVLGVPGAATLSDVSAYVALAAWVAVTGWLVAARASPGRGG